jgi:hypothetical protein
MEQVVQAVPKIKYNQKVPWVEVKEYLLFRRKFKKV